MGVVQAGRAVMVEAWVGKVVAREMEEVLVVKEVQGVGWEVEGLGKEVEPAQVHSQHSACINSGPSGKLPIICMPVHAD
jgi:hypothetical protein